MNHKIHIWIVSILVCCLCIVQGCFLQSASIRTDTPQSPSSSIQKEDPQPVATEISQLFQARGDYINDNKINLAWDYDRHDVTQWVIFRQEWGASKNKRIAIEDPHARSYTDTDNLTQSHLWTYYIRGKNKERTVVSATVRVWHIEPNDPDKGLTNFSAIAPNAEVWMTNRPGRKSSHENRLITGLSEDWSDTAKNLDVCVLYFSSIRDASMQDLRAMVRAAKTRGIKIGVELGGISDNIALKSSQDVVGELSFARQQKVLKRLSDPIEKGGAGGEIASLIFDGPVHRAVYPKENRTKGLNMERATDEVVDMLGLWQKTYPQAELYLLANFSNWGWDGSPARNNLGLPPGDRGFGDYKVVLDKMLAKTDRAQVKLRGLIVDTPYDSAIGEAPTNQVRAVSNIDWVARLRKLENYVKSADKKFGLIYNSFRGGHHSNFAFATEVLNYIDLYHGAGGRPDYYIIQSWYDYPTQWIPDFQRNTMTDLVGRVIDRIITRRPEFLAMEAEDSDRLEQPFVIRQDPHASGGAYIEVKEGNNATGVAPPTTGKAKYQFQLHQPEKIDVWFRVKTPSLGDNSFWVNIEDDPQQWHEWYRDIPVSTEWIWLKWNQFPIKLDPGTHDLEVAYREDGTKLDRVMLVSDREIVHPAVVNAGDNLLFDPSFESDNLTIKATDWQTENFGNPANSNANYIEHSATAFDGHSMLKHYQQEPYEVITEQTIKGITNGNYIATAWVKANNKNQIEQFKVKDFDNHQSILSQDIPESQDWQLLVIENIHITNNQCKIYFHNKSSGGGEILVDKVSLQRIY